MHSSANELQNFIARLDRRIYALLIGAALGVIGGLVGLSLAVLDPLLTFGAVFGLLAGLYVLTNISAALYGMIAVAFLLPFGTFPIRIGFTPTLLDIALGAFLIVYLFQWMTGKRRGLQITPVHWLVLLYLLWLILAFVLGLRYAPPTSTILRQFAEALLSISLVFIVGDLARDPATLRRLVLVILVIVGVQALIGLILYALPDAVAERQLIRLARLGYPNGGVIRYIEDNPALDERAIGTWVDPNAYGGLLAIAATWIAPQVFAEKPVLRYRWLSLIVLGLAAVALFLTYSRASMLAFATGLGFIAVMRYRKLIPLMLAGAALILLLPQAQDYVQRFVDAFTASDLATQMRIGEYTDSFRLIQRYPISGVGFTGTPDIDIYTNAASMYLIMANQIGLVGVGLFLILIGGVFAYGLQSWRSARADLAAIHLGCHAALLAALVNGAFDLYFFRTDFQASNLLFWLAVTLALASARLALQPHPAIGGTSPVPHTSK
jgi:O-antigen ligase